MNELLVLLKTWAVLESSNNKDTATYVYSGNLASEVLMYTAVISLQRLIDT